MGLSYLGRIGESSGQISHGSPQITPAQDYERKREFSVPRFVADYQTVVTLLLHVSSIIYISTSVPTCLVNPHNIFLTKSGLVAEPEPRVRRSEQLPEPR